MASRQVKKLLQQQREAELLKVQQSEDEEEEQQPSAAPFNPFDLLDDEDDEPTQQADEDEDEPDEEPSQPEAEPAVNKTQAVSKKSNSKKKKKNKGKKGKASQAGASDEEDAAKPSTTEGIEDIDRLVQELNLTTVGDQEASTQEAGGAVSGNGCVSTTCSLLAVDAQALKGDDELRRIFGSSVVAAVDREELADAARRRRNAAMARGRPAVAAALRRAGRRGVLVSPKEHWPPLDSNITMEFTGVEDGVRHFRYVWSPAYHHTQRTFERCQASHDPNAIAALLQHAPYHVDSLLSMYELYRHLGENQYAEEVLHRALHALEMAWHPQFDVRTAQCRLDFEVEENRPLFLALFRHVQGLSRAGCHRTALECAKLLLALQPEDPMGVLCMMDYLAIRAGRYSYLEEFVQGWEDDSALALRPNYAYGLAMAAYRMQQAGGSSSGTSTSSTTRSPSSQLLTAILMHPSVVPKVLSKLQEKGTGREPQWTALLQRKLFAKPHDAQSATLQHLCSLYAERSALLWKPPEVLEFLRQVATRAADVAEAGGVRKSGSVSQASPDAEDLSLSLDDLICVRKEAFPNDSYNEFRHVRLADFTDNVNALPREELGAPVAAPPDAAAAAAAAAQAAHAGRGRRRGQAAGGGQGLGGIGLEDVDPAVLEEIQEQIALAQMQQMQGGGGGAQGSGQGATDEELQGANPLMMLLRSLLPWVNVGQQPDYEAEEEGGGGAGTGGPQQPPAAGQ